MTYVACGVAGLVLAVIAAASLTTAGCTRCECSSSNGAAVVSLPAAASNPIVRTGAGTPCTTSFNSPNIVIIFAAASGTCPVFAELTNGDVWMFTADIKVGESECCGATFELANTPVPMLIAKGDGGTVDGRAD